MERQNTLYDEEQYEQPFDTCSELNYNLNYNNDEYHDGYGYNQQWLNGDNNYDSYGYSNSKKALPQPPMSYSQSVNDGFSHRFIHEFLKLIGGFSSFENSCLFRGASLPATPSSQQRYNRQLPKHTSPTHQPQSRGLPKLTRQLPSSIESAASTFSSLFGVGRNAKRSVPTMNEQEPQGKSLFSLLSESKPQVSQPENYVNNSIYNENFNYAYNSMDSTDELMGIEEKYDGDNNNLLNGRLGAALPTLPSYEKSSSIDYDPYR